MAIWQYKLMLVPRGGPAVRGDWDAVHWRHMQPRLPLDSLIPPSLPPAQSWSDRLRLWGDVNRDCIAAIYSSAGTLETVEVTIDARHPNKAFISEICAVAASLDAVFLDAAQREIEPVPTLVEAALATSLATRFVLRQLGPGP